MAQLIKEEESVEITSKWGGLKLAGPNALILLLIFVLLGNIGFAYYEHNRRAEEHNHITCYIRLQLYVWTIPPGERQINWHTLPTDLYGCVPRFLWERTPDKR